MWPTENAHRLRAVSNEEAHRLAPRRHVRFMAKTELIQARYGRLLVRLGAFPVRCGQAVRTRSKRPHRPAPGRPPGAVPEARGYATRTTSASRAAAPAGSRSRQA